MESNDTITPFANPPGEQRDGFIEGISRHYPLSEEMIARCEDQWDWKGLIRNEALPWDGELITRFEDRWSWEELSRNETLPWSEELVARFENQWDRGGLPSDALMKFTPDEIRQIMSDFDLQS